MSLRRPFAVAFGLLTLCVALSAPAQETVRIGYQKSSTLITLLKTQGTLDAATVEAANAHRSYQVQPVTLEQLGEQQNIADAFFKAGLLPRAVGAKAVQTWQP